MLSFPAPVPKNGDDLDATPVGQDLDYLLQVLQAYDLSNVLPGSALDTLFAPSNSPLQRFADWGQSFVVGGGLPSGFSTLSYTVPAIIGATFASNGVRVASILGQSFTAAINSDTYVSARSTGVINTPQVVANGAAAPALPTTDSQWLCKIVSNGTTITSIADLRNLDPTGRFLAFTPTSLALSCPVSVWTDVMPAIQAPYVGKTLEVKHQVQNQTDFSGSVACNLVMYQLLVDGNPVGGTIYFPGVGINSDGPGGYMAWPISGLTLGLHSFKVQCQPFNVTITVNRYSAGFCKVGIM